MDNIHGGDVYEMEEQLGIPIEKLLDFSANLNPLGIPPGVQEAVIKSMSRIVHYPDPQCRRLVSAIADAQQVPKEWILCGNGAADLIYRMIYAIKPKRVLLAEPTFLEYEEALMQAGVEIVPYAMGEELCVDSRIIEAMNEGIQMMFVCNPNNPTGIVIEKDVLMQILKKAKETGLYLVIDECFLDFCEKKEKITMRASLKEYDRIVIVKSFTKMYAIPGLRLGYLMCQNEELLYKINKAGQSWSVNSIAQAAGIQALGETGFAEKSRKFIKTERVYLKKSLKQIGCQIYDSSVNYILFYREGCYDLRERLLSHYIIIRDCRNYRGLGKGYYRIAVRGRKDNERLIAKLEDIFKEL